MCALNYIENCFSQVNDQFSSAVMSADKTFSKEEVIEQFLSLIKRKMKFSIINWEPPRKEYPSHMFLSNDKGILAYVDFKYFESTENFSDSDISFNSNLLLKTLCSADSQLDRPVFFVYILNFSDKQGVYFETNEQIKDRWFKNSFSSEYYVPVIDEMGDLKNLLKLWNDLKKNSVRV